MRLLGYLSAILCAFSSSAHLFPHGDPQILSEDGVAISWYKLNDSSLAFRISAPAGHQGWIRLGFGDQDAYLGYLSKESGPNVVDLYRNLDKNEFSVDKEQNAQDYKISVDSKGMMTVRFIRDLDTGDLEDIRLDNGAVDLSWAFGKKFSGDVNMDEIKGSGNKHVDVLAQSKDKSFIRYGLRGKKQIDLADKVNKKDFDQKGEIDPRHHHEEKDHEEKESCHHHPHHPHHHHRHHRKHRRERVEREELRNNHRRERSEREESRNNQDLKLDRRAPSNQDESIHRNDKDTPQRDRQGHSPREHGRERPSILQRLIRFFGGDHDHDDRHPPKHPRHDDQSDNDSDNDNDN
jgi:hypothetical protein